MRGKFVKGRKLSALAEKFINGECKVIYGPMYAFWFGEDVITWSDCESLALNAAWGTWLKENFDFDLTNDNVFAMSILHELGHYYTWDSFTEEEWDNDRQHEECINKAMTTENFFEKQHEYFDMPTEKAATTWAIETYKANASIMRRWNRRFACAIRHYEKQTGRVVFERC